MLHIQLITLSRNVTFKYFFFHFLLLCQPVPCHYFFQKNQQFFSKSTKISVNFILNFLIQANRNPTKLGTEIKLCNKTPHLTAQK